MKLYYSKGACSLAVRIVLHEIGVDCAFEAVNLKTKKTETGEDYLKINPKGAVPALLLEPGVVLTENVVIQQYLAEKYGSTDLLPKEIGLERFRVLEMLSFVSSDLHRLFGVLFNPNIPEEIKQNIYIPLIKTKLQYTNSLLEKKSFLAADRFTLPDSYLFVILLWTFHFSIALSDYPHLSQYFDRIKQRASVARALQEEGIN